MPLSFTSHSAGAMGGVWPNAGACSDALSACSTMGRSAARSNTSLLMIGTTWRNDHAHAARVSAGGSAAATRRQGPGLDLTYGRALWSVGTACPRDAREKSAIRAIRLRVRFFNPLEGARTGAEL